MTHFPDGLSAKRRSLEVLNDFFFRLISGFSLRLHLHYVFIHTFKSQQTKQTNRNKKINQ